MKIRENTWHWMYATRFDAKYIEWMNSISICEYAKSVIQGLFITWVAVYILSCTAIWLVLHSLSVYEFGMAIPQEEVPLMLSYVVGSFGTLVVLGFAFMIMLFFLVTVPIELFQKAKKSKSVSENIILTYIKAKKNKFCPILEIERETKDV